MKANYWTCWRCDAVNDLGASACEQCGAKNNPRNAEPTKPACDGCGESSSLNTFHADGHPDDAGKRLCASCWVHALRRRAELHPISASARASCLATIRALDLRFPTTRIDAR